MSVPCIERVVQLGEELASLNLALDTVYSNVLRSVKRLIHVKHRDWRLFCFRTVLKILIPGWSRLTECHRKCLSARQIEFRKRKTYRLVDMLILCSKMKHSSWHLCTFTSLKILIISINSRHHHIIRCEIKSCVHSNPGLTEHNEANYPSAMKLVKLSSFVPSRNNI